MKSALKIFSIKKQLFFFLFVALSLPLVMYSLKNTQDNRQQALTLDLTGQTTTCPAGQFDTLDYFLTDHPEQEVEYFAQIIDGNKTSGRVFYTRSSELFELYAWDPNFIYLREDHAYVYQGLHPYTLGDAKWMKRCMAVGEKLVVNSQTSGNPMPIQFHDSSCKPIERIDNARISGKFDITMTLVRAETKQIPALNPNAAQQTITLRYDVWGDGLDYEEYVFTKEWGLIEWSQWSNSSSRSNVDEFRKISTIYDNDGYPVKTELSCSPIGKPPVPTLIPTVTPTINPAQPEPTSPPAGGPTLQPGEVGQGTIYIQIKDATSGEFLDINSGTLYISTEDGRDTDTYNLAGAITQDDCFRVSAIKGTFRCETPTKHLADRWYGGLSEEAPPVGYTIVDSGIAKAQDTPLSLNDRGRITIDVLLRSQSATGGTNTNPPHVPNCSNIQGPTTIRLGQSATYVAQFSTPTGSSMFGVINAMKATNTTPTAAQSWDWSIFPPTEITQNSASLSFTWKPESEGLYQVFCRAWNPTSGNAECRGSGLTIPAGDTSKYTCTGPNAVLSVNVTSADVGTPGTSTDMCQFATTIGNSMSLGGSNSRSSTVTPDTPVSVAVIARPGVNAKGYTYAFYNLDNTEDNKPKPIMFASGTQYLVDSENNTLEVKFEDIDKVDVNSGKKPTNIQVQAHLVDQTGLLSAASPNCVVNMAVANPQLTAQASVPTTAPQNSSPSNLGAVLASVGVLIVGTVIALNFFLH